LVNVTCPVKLVTTLLLESTRPTTMAGLMAAFVSVLEGGVRNLKLQPPVTVVWMDEIAASRLAPAPVPTGVPLHAVESQFPVVALQLTLTLRASANVPPDASGVIPETLTDPPPAATVAVPLGGVAETIVKPAGAMSDSEPNDVPFDAGFVYVAVIDCPDVPAVTGDGVTLRPYLHGDGDTVVCIEDDPALMLAWTPLFTGVPLHTVEPQLAVVAAQLILTESGRTNVPPGASVIPATLTDPPPVAIVAAPLGADAETIVKPGGAVRDSERNDVVFEEGLVNVAVIACADVPAVTGDGVTLRL